MATYTSAHICYASIVIASACIRVYSRSWSAVQAVACTATVAHLVHCQCVNLVLVLQLVHHEEKKGAQTTVAAKMCILWHVEDWQIEYDRECSTMSRLNCEATTVANSKRVVVYKLKCKVCSRYEDKIKGRKKLQQEVEHRFWIRTNKQRLRSFSQRSAYACYDAVEWGAQPVLWIGSRVICSNCRGMELLAI